jgi:hypothetical protein
MPNTHAEVKEGYFICNNNKASAKKLGAKLEMKTTKITKGSKRREGKLKDSKKQNMFSPFHVIQRNRKPNISEPLVIRHSADLISRKESKITTKWLATAGIQFPMISWIWLTNRTQMNLTVF